MVNQCRRELDQYRRVICSVLRGVRIITRPRRPIERRRSLLIAMIGLAYAQECRN